jgi:hypothetical protein
MESILDVESENNNRGKENNQLRIHAVGEIIRLKHGSSIKPISQANEHEKSQYICYLQIELKKRRSNVRNTETGKNTLNHHLQRVRLYCEKSKKDTRMSKTRHHLSPNIFLAKYINKQYLNSFSETVDSISPLPLHRIHENNQMVNFIKEIAKASHEQNCHENRFHRYI